MSPLYINLFEVIRICSDYLNAPCFENDTFLIQLNRQAIISIVMVTWQNYHDIKRVGIYHDIEKVGNYSLVTLVRNLS